MKKNNFFCIWISIILVSLSALGGCSSKKDEVLAKVNERVITLSEFNERISKLPPEYQNLLKKDKARLLDDFIVELLFCEEAVQHRIDKQKDTKEILKEARRKILMAKFIEEEIEKKTSIEEAELIDYYEKHKDKFIIPEKFRASHILVRTEEKAKEILDKLSGGANFEELAASESMDITNKRGGDIGYFTKGKLIPEFEEACMKLEIGQISHIIKTSFGYHIIKLTEKKPVCVKEFEEVKDEIKAELNTLKKREKFNRIVQDLKSKALIEINYNLIKDE